MPASLDLSVALLRPLAELLTRTGHDGDGFRAALAIDDATRPDTYVAGAEVDRLLSALAAGDRDRAFGLTLAVAAQARMLGVFGHLVWLSGTLRDALTRAVRFYGAVSRRTTLSLDEATADGGATLRQHRVGDAIRGPILTEFSFASTVLRARAATGGRFRLRAVAFAHAARRPLAPAYAEVFAAPVRFGAAVDELVFDRDQLELVLAGADPITAAALEPTVAQLAADPTDPLLARIRRAIAADLAAPVTVTTLAPRLGTSARTLRRQLEREGTSLRALLDDARRRRADELLAAGTAVKEASFQLGFSEPSAFSRAYKRWTGRSPVVVRAPRRR